MALAAGLQFRSGSFTAILEIHADPLVTKNTKSVAQKHAGHANQCAKWHTCLWLVIIENSRVEPWPLRSHCDRRLAVGCALLSTGLLACLLIGDECHFRLLLLMTYYHLQNDDDVGPLATLCLSKSTRASYYVGKRGLM